MPRCRSTVRIGVALVLLLSAAACTHGSTGANDPLGAKPMSSPAPALSGETLDGSTASLADLLGNVVVVNFWATWCKPCREEQPELEQVHRDYRGRGVSFLGVNERDDSAAARAWVREFHVTYPSIVDEPGSWADDFGLFGYPDTFVVDAGGTIRWAIYGQTSGAQLREILDRVLAPSS
jgi:cytochrome c biogenesis protein CcmG/thiol:disulfide interchange protein DsbE